MTIPKIQSPPIHMMSTGFSPKKPLADPFTSTRQLFSTLKKLITQAQGKAHDAYLMGDLKKMADLRKAADYASKKLKEIVDGKVSAQSIDNELRDAIKAVETQLSK